MYILVKEMDGPKQGESGIGGENREEGNTESSRGEIMGPGARNGKGRTTLRKRKAGCRERGAHLPNSRTLLDGRLDCGPAQRLQEEKKKRLGVITTQWGGGNPSFSSPLEVLPETRDCRRDFRVCARTCARAPSVSPPFAENMRKWRVRTLRERGERARPRDFT